MATVFECDRCKQLDRGDGEGRRAIQVGQGRCAKPPIVVCAECAAKVESFVSTVSTAEFAIALGVQRAVCAKIWEALDLPPGARDYQRIERVRTALRDLDPKETP